MLEKYTHRFKCHTGLDTIIELLIDNGADINDYHNNVSALITAVAAGLCKKKLNAQEVLQKRFFFRSGSESTVELLIQKGSNVHHTLESGLTTIMLATLNGKHELNKII